jgi:hypothetical protein
MQIRHSQGGFLGEAQFDVVRDPGGLTIGEDKLGK